MAFSDPQTITVSAVARVCNRIASGDGTGSFQESDGNFRIDVLHTSGKRFGHQLKITITKIAPNPLISAQNIVYSSSIFIRFDVPRTGFDSAELLAFWTGVSTWVNASSAAVITKLIGGEN